MSLLLYIKVKRIHFCHLFVYSNDIPNLLTQYVVEHIPCFTFYIIVNDPKCWSLFIRLLMLYC